MEDRLATEVASIVEVAIQSTVSVFRDVLTKEAPNTVWEEAKFGGIQDIQKSLVVQLQKAFTELYSELCDENEALRSKVEHLEDVLQKKAGQLEQELEARMGQLGREMEQLEKELKNISESSSKTHGDPAAVAPPGVSATGEQKPQHRTILLVFQVEQKRLESEEKRSVFTE